MGVREIPTGVLGFLIFLLGVSSGCTPLSPPPLFPRHASVAPLEEGAVTVTLAVGVGGAAISSGLGLEVRVAWQIADALAVGVGIGGGVGGGDTLPRELASTRILAFRLFARANPADAVVLLGGAGISHMSSGLLAMTFDAGAATGHAIGDVVEPSLGLAAALSVPLLQGDAFTVGGRAVLPTTTFYYGGNLGLGVHLGDNLVSGEVGVYGAQTGGGKSATVFHLSAADGHGFGP